MSAPVPSALERGRTLAVPALKAAVERLHPSLRDVVAYHRGWVGLDGKPAGGGGKLLRPALAVLSAEAAGAAPEVGLPAAVAVELVHDFSLLHDDLMDGDRERRHRPTAWVAFSPGSAVLAGDGLLSLATQVLLEQPAPAGPAAARILTDGVVRLVDGQAEDLLFESRTDVTVERVLAMEGGKTGALLACATALGAVLAGAPDELVDGLATYGEELGLAFQLVDDLLGIWGDPAVTGKPVLNDLRQRKKSVPVVVALAGGGASAKALRRFLTQEGDPGEDDLREAAALVEEAGGRTWTAEEADRRLNACVDLVRSLPIPAATADELVAIARYVTARDR